MAEPRVFLGSRYNESSSFSPSGRYVVYTADESGRDEICVRTYPEAGDRLQISVDGGQGARFTKNGSEIVYVQGESMMSVPIEEENGRLIAGPPERLFDGPFVWGRPGNYDVSADGERFLMLQRPLEDERREDDIRVIVGWYSELLRRVPIED